MIFFRSSQRALYERLLEEKDRQIALLAEEVDYLRLQLGTAKLRAVEPVNPSDQPVRLEDDLPFVGEAEEDLYHMHEQGIIDNEELDAAVQALRARGGPTE